MLPVVTLPVAMIELALRASLLAAVGGAALQTSGVRPRFAVRTSREHRLASLTAANPLPENHFFLTAIRPRTVVSDILVIMS
jgi:hypothetical protein